jgi:hypothetical protein
MGKNSYNVPIEQGSLSQSSTTANSANASVTATVPNISNQNIPDQPTVSAQPSLQTQASQNVQSEQPELEIKKQSLPIENQTNTPSPSSTDSKPNQNTNTSISTDDDAGVPR